MTYFNGEQIVEQDSPAEEQLPRDLRDNNHRNAVPAQNSHGGPNTRRIGNDEPCGGGRRVVRKRID